VDYVATRDAGKPAAARGIYRVLDDGGMDLPGPRKADPAVHLRRILVYSPANAAGQAKARALKLAKATEDLNRLVRTAGTRFHPTPDAVAARVKAITAQRRVGAYLRTAITRGAAGKPVLSWHFDQAAIDPRGRGRRLGCPADQSGARPGRPGGGLPPPQGPARRRTPLRRVQRPPRGRPPVPQDQPPHHCAGARAAIPSSRQPTLPGRMKPLQAISRSDRSCMR
jgi:hypothetical protein